MPNIIKYQENAFILKDINLFNVERNVVVDHENTDLSLFIGCPYMMGGSIYNNYLTWYDYQKKPKVHGYVSPSFIKNIKQRHKYYFKAMFGSNTSFFTLLWVLSIAGILGGGVHAFWTFYFWASFRFTTLFQSFLDSGTFWFIGVSFVLSQIGKYGGYYADDETGYAFFRETGKVKLVGKRVTTDKEYDFKDFTAYSAMERNTGGAMIQNTYVFHKETGRSFTIESDGFTSGVLAWNYLVKFMDVTQPLPDIPIHETTRHLDPVTKDYDEKTGRKPNYWANMTRIEAREIHQQENKKAKDWIEDRKELLDKKGINDLEFLNNLVKKHLV